jgi:hypothetical protein
MKTDGNRADKWIPAAQAAEKLGTTSLNILMHIKRDLLFGVENDGVWLVESASLEALILKRTQGNVPDVCQRGCTKHAGGCGFCA